MRLLVRQLLLLLLFSCCYLAENVAESLEVMLLLVPQPVLSALYCCCQVMRCLRYGITFCEGWLSYVLGNELHYVTDSFFSCQPGEASNTL